MKANGWQLRGVAVTCLGVKLYVCVLSWRRADFLQRRHFFHPPEFLHSTTIRGISREPEDVSNREFLPHANEVQPAV